MKDEQELHKAEETGMSEIVEEVADEKERLKEELREVQDKYLRLYAEFENYKKRMNREKEDLLNYGVERLVGELLPVIDTLEMALKHAVDKTSKGLAEGVENTLRELRRTLGKFGLNPIEALGEKFDPSVHHAMSVVERDDLDENMVVEEFRKGYMFRDKVLRAPLVCVSKRPSGMEREEQVEKKGENKNIEEES
ncbi:MAG: nucleotide exchange factor GrpE [Nitrospirota bacterium]